MKREWFIMGDSFSTYAGYNPDGYRSFYGDERVEAPIVGGVEKTWWKMLEKTANSHIAMNDSYSGSTICNTVREELPVSSSFVNRIDRYINDGYFSYNKIDTLFVFGGTNDSCIDAPLGELIFSDWEASDLRSVLPAFCYLLYKARSADNQMKIVVVVNTDLRPELVEGMVSACEKYHVDCIQLTNIDKIIGHPTELGMKQIADQIMKRLY